MKLREELKMLKDIAFTAIGYFAIGGVATTLMAAIIKLSN